MKWEKKDLEHRNCCVCNSDAFQKLFSKGGFHFVQCNKCQFIYVNPSITSKALKKYYARTMEAYWEDQKTPELTNLLSKKFNDELKCVEKFIQKGKVLDVGCGAGIFMHHANNRGWKVYGTEFNKFSIDFIKNVLRIKNVYSEDLSHFNKNTFELVTLHQIFEHLPDPNAMLNDIHRILKKEGLLFISVPNVYGIITRIMKNKSQHYDGNGHLNYFNKKNLKTILEKNNFEVITFKTDGFRADFLLEHFKSKLSNKVKQQPPQLKNGAQYKINKFIFHLYYFISFFLNKLLLGDYLIVIARKK